MMLTPHEITSGLAGFTGSTTFTRHFLGRTLIMTEGVVWLRDAADCHWLVDAIFSHIATNKRLQKERFLTWTFTRNGADVAAPNRPHRLEVGDGNSRRAIVHQDIALTDFPLPHIVLWAEKNELGGYTLMLPNEH